MSWRVTVDEAGKGRTLDVTIQEWALNDAVELALSDVYAEDSDGREFQITATPVPG